jgi:hypothetical protein
MRYEMVGQVREWTFYEVTGHGFSGEYDGKPLYGFAVGKVKTPKGEPKTGELYASLEHAMVAAVGEKYTGERGAGGSGTDTAAGWFMRMIGADQLVPADNARMVLAGAIEVAEAEGNRPPVAMAQRVDAALRDEGYTLARVNR